MGAAAGLWWALWSFPPGYAQNWADGALGERWTVQQLRRLHGDGWVVVHDRWLGRGNVDRPTGWLQRHNTQQLSPATARRGRSLSLSIPS